jgi:predicted PurR-regulated permease PerM
MTLHLAAKAADTLTLTTQELAVGFFTTLLIGIVLGARLYPPVRARMRHATDVARYWVETLTMVVGILVIAGGIGWMVWTVAAAPK